VTAPGSVQIHIDLSRQQLQLLEAEQSYRFSVSTALNGPGERLGSGCTPRGRHRIRAKIGGGCPSGTVFVGRRATGEIYTPDLALAQPDRDWILTRILWLCGEQPGFNRLGDRDSMQRFIYIHGTPDSEPMGQPLSHGCIRMRNDELIWLFDRVAVGTVVQIDE
jgi:hypothetical protein